MLIEILTEIALTLSTAAPAPPPASLPAARAAIAAPEYRAVRCDAGRAFEARNPAQGMSTSYSADGIRIRGVDRAETPFHWGLSLRSWGREGSLDEAREAEIRAEGSRVEYRRGELVEWYLNEPRGLEHGVTLAAPPPMSSTDGESAPLEVRYEILGEWRAELRPDHRGVTFHRRDGLVTLSYTGLVAWDARGRDLTASIAIERGTLSLLVDDAAAEYPVTIDPLIWLETAELFPSDGSGSEQFGGAVSLSGDRVLIGAPLGDASGTADTGAAYVFKRTGLQWTQEAKLVASNGATGDQFGISVCLDGEIAVVGADLSHSDGRVYVYERSGGFWIQTAELSPSFGATSGLFGHSVSIDGDTIVVGAPSAANDHGFNAGAAYVYTDSGTSWIEQGRLTANDGALLDVFGNSVSLDGGTVLIGAPWKATSAGVYAGSAYVFVGSGATWSEQAKLVPGDTQAYGTFGHCVSLAGEEALIGASKHGAPLTAGNGAAYVFGRSGVTWNQHAKLTPLVGQDGDEFGSGVALSADRAVVGAQGWTFPSYQGAAYVFERPSTGWVDATEDVELPLARGGSGFAVALEGTTTIVGSPFGNTVQVLDRIDEPGFGYCFGDPGSGTPCPCSNDNNGGIPGSGCANGVFSVGAKLFATGVASVSADTLVLTATHLEPNNSGLYFQADNDLSPGSVWGDGLRCAGGSLKRLQVRFADALGSSSTTVGISAKAGNVSAGSTKRYQCWYRTTVNPPCGIGVNDFNASNGYEIAWTL